MSTHNPSRVLNDTGTDGTPVVTEHFKPGNNIYDEKKSIESFNMFNAPILTGRNGQNMVIDLDVPEGQAGIHIVTATKSQISGNNDL